MRRAKIVATLGPATESKEQLVKLMNAGLNVARMNMSHGTYETHEKVYNNIRKASEESGKTCGILADLQGPKIRLETIAAGPQVLEPGDKFTITVRDVPGDKEVCGTTYKGLPGDVTVGDTLLIDDGNVGLRATKVTDTDVETVVEIGGKISDHKGINLPGVAVSVPALSEKDEADLRWALNLGVDIIALSFVRSANDISRVHEIMEEEGRRLPVIAKIEKPQAVENLQEIIDAFDGIMVARGDLAVEIPLEAVPVIQKQAIEMARRWAKPVIVATQMLESMITNNRPTRAEASDVANAVLDGADAVMLSAESSVGKYPVEAVATMARIIESTEDHGLDRIPPLGSKPHTQGGAVTRAAAELAEFLGAKYVCVFTASGDSARRISRLRLPIPMLTFSHNASTRQRMTLYWGVEGIAADYLDSNEGMVEAVETFLKKTNRAEDGDVVIVVSGTPGQKGSTNRVNVLTIGAPQSSTKA